MDKAKTKAWNCLTALEQKSLHLTLSQGLSTWQAGEILNIHHYKYLELKARSEKFFRIFSDFFELHEDIIRPGAMKDNVRDYFYAAILKRLNKNDCIDYAGDNQFRLLSTRKTSITNAVKKLKKSENKWDRDTYKLIIEFDRWNNFRILPKELQAPTAYTRRKAKKEKSYFRYLNNFPEPTLKKLIDLIWYNGKPFRVLYFVAITDTLSEEGYVIVPFKKSPKNIEHLTNLKFFIFHDISTSELFGMLVKRYNTEVDDPKSGHIFWKEYRNVIEKALNYKELTNIDVFHDTLDTMKS